MKFKKVAIVVGTRPEVIKFYPVLVELHNRNINTLLISTGQQKDLIAETFESLLIHPDIDLNLMTENQTPAAFLTRTINELSSIFSKEEFDLVLVQGDTLSAFAGAQAAYLCSIKLGHVEAGLRSHSLYSPWPEEGIRRAIDAISNFLWVPTEDDVIECEPDQECIVTGNTVVDALRLIRSSSSAEVIEDKQIIVTLHRRESFGIIMTKALEALVEYSKTCEYKILFIQHPNPNVQNSVSAARIKESRIEISPPIPYARFIKLLQNCKLLITDSGGLQEEATILGIPTLILRDTTERAAAITEGRSLLSSPDGRSLAADANHLININKSSHVLNLVFGDGYAAKKIVDSVFGVRND